MARTSQKELETIVKRISQMTGIEYGLDHNAAYGGYRLIHYYPGSSAESDVSPRLPKGQFADWLYAFEKGIDLGMRADEYRAHIARVARGH